MNLFSTTLATIKRHRFQFSISWGICLFALFSLTSLGVLRSILIQLDSLDQIKLFTKPEIKQLQEYFANRLLFCCIGFFCLLLFGFILRLYSQKKYTTSLKQLIYTTGLEFFIVLIVATISLILFFAIFEPVYESVLQNLYHQGLNQFKNLPNFVLSNGTSGIAYSIRSSLSFELSSMTLLDLFFSALLKACIFLVASLGVMILLLQTINRIHKRKNVR
ncbi:hypothetical protein [Enterococcus viikkiensis]|uniref:hypothetical protein n=1 Tax=Enterococcus viikkiensis TaxID=930854 RepID=UPI0010F64160|nr:hypothetical protein [Enterococcus viikkiensis]